MFTELLILIITLVFLVNLYISWNDNYWLKQDIPFIEPKKIFGNIKDVIMMKKTMGEVYMDIYRKLSGKPVGGFFKLRTPILMIRDPELIGRVLEDDFGTFHDNDVQVMRDVDPIFKMNPFVSRGAVWRSRRDVLKPCESSQTLKKMVPLLRPICDAMVKFIKSYSILPIEVKELSGKYTTDVVASLVFGIELNSLKESESQFRTMTRKLFNAGIKSNIALLLAFYAPAVNNILKFRIIPKHVADYFIKVVTEKCKQRVMSGKQRNDFLQELININKESEANGEGTVYKYSEMAGHCITFLTGGYYTSASTLCFSLYELAMNPECQTKVREEILAKGECLEDFDYDKIESLQYLRMFICESLRLHPPIQTITRLCMKDTVLQYDEHKYSVKEGTPVTVPICALHMDPQFYEDPNKFSPERFDFETEALRTPNVFLPFGSGPRTCLGLNFAMMQLKIALISLLLNFAIEPRDVLNDLRQDPQKSFFTTPKGNVKLSFKVLPKS